MIFQISLNVFTSFSDKNNIIFKTWLLQSNLLSPVWETETLPLSHRDTTDREDI